ncbi:MAG: dephospho-CoA kinase [Dehalococcoidia bacterium]|nr:dephospho-CoA kinase [Dehalococcoidia bacterium]
MVIGVTGGIGTGKSTVTRILRELGAVVIDADALGHEAYRPGTQAWQEVVEAFGTDILLPSGEVDRKRLGAIVFNDPQALARLNAIMHPKMFRMAQERIQQAKAQGHQVIVLEAAILLEAGWDPLVDEIWVVTAPEAVAVERAQARTGLPREAILARVRAQMPPQERIRRAHVVIDNAGSLEDLRRRLETLWQERIVTRR